MKNLVLAYHSAQQPLAKQLDADLALVDYAVVHIHEQQVGTHGSLGDALIQTEGPILLLVSDNLLKDMVCMDNLFAAADALYKEHRLLAVVVPGVDEKGIPVPTQFEKISQIIQYMNFWQDRYLELRREKRQIPPGAQARAEAIQAELNRVKKIAGEIGELLRFLKAIPTLDEQGLKANHYEALFKWLDDPTGHVALLTAKQRQEAASRAKDEADEGPAAPPPAAEPTDGPVAQDSPSSTEELVQLIKSSEAQLMAELHGSMPSATESPLTSPAEEQGTDDLSEKETTPQPPAPESEPQAESRPPEESDEEDIELIQLDDGGDEESVLAPFPEPSQEELERLFEIEEEEEAATEDENPPAAPSSAVAAAAPTVTDLDTLDEEEAGGEDAGSARPPHEEEVHHTPSDHQTRDEELARRLADEGLELVRQGRLHEALRQFEEAIAAHPDNVVLRYEYAFFLAKYAHDVAAATRILEEVRAMDPDFADAWFLLGELAETHGDYHLARNYYEKVLELDPDYPGLHYHLGVLLFNHFLPDEAERAARHLKKSLKHYKKNADAHYRLAILYDEYLGRPEKAVKHFKKTLKYEPAHPLAAYDLAVRYHRQEAWELARHYYQLACELNPEVKTPENDLAFGLTTDEEGFPLADQVHVHDFGQAAAARPTPASDTEEVPPGEDASTGHAQSVAEEGTPGTVPNEQPPLAQSTEDEPQPKGGGKPARTRRRPIALITGATSGIGRATAARFAEAGYDLIITGRRLERLAALAQEWQQTFGIRVLPLCFDLRDRQAVEANLGQLPEEWAQVDVLVNNAGLAMGLAPIHEGDPDDWDTMIDTNIKGLLYVTRQIAPGMVARRKGHIVNVASTAGKEVYPNGNVYCATKHAVDALTRAMRLDLYKYRVRVSQVAPAHVEETEFALVRFKGDAERARIYDDFQPLKAGDVANAIYYIVSQPPHVNVQDVLLMGTQQANSIFIDRSGRDWLEEEE